MSGPLPFKPNDNIPILGQLCTPLACVSIAVVRCNCEAKTIVTIEGIAAVAQCPACKRCHKIVAVSYNAMTNEGTVSINSFMLPTEATGAPAPEGDAGTTKH